MQKLFQLLALLFLILFFSGCSDTGTTLNETEHEGSAPKTIILAIDGGGIKGIIPALFLDTIEQRLKKASYQLFDIIGGTSTGGIISAALVTPDTTKKPYTANAIASIYKKNGAKIFVKRDRSCVLCCKTCAKYYEEHKGGGVNPYMQSMFGDNFSLKKSHIFIQGLTAPKVKQMFTTSYIVNSDGGKHSNPVLGKDYGPYLFNWYDAINKDSTKNDYYVWEAARGTSAAPSYFPIANVGGNKGKQSSAPEKWVVDGGVMSNDPAVWGVSEAFRTGLAEDLKDIVVISLGTGLYPGSAGVGIKNEGYTIPKNGDWDEGVWVGEPISIYDLEEKKDGNLVTVILDAVQLVTNSQLEGMQKGGLQYYRLEPSLSYDQRQMDNIDPGNINSLITTANDYLKGDGKSTLDNIVAILKESLNTK